MVDNSYEQSTQNLDEPPPNIKWRTYNFAEVAFPGPPPLRNIKNEI